MSDDPNSVPLIHPKSQELTDLVEFARSDLPSDEQWAALTAQVANVWGGEPNGLEQVDAPASHVSPAAKAGTGGGAKVAAQSSLVLPGAAKVAGVAMLAGALASGAWFATRPAPTDHSAAVAAPPMVVEAPNATTGPAAALAPSAPAALVEGPVAPVASVEPSPKAAAAPSELRLLTRARDVLSKDPEQSLALCRQHQRMYPQGQLAQEREVLLIEALTRLNRDREAGQRRVQFGKTFPDSPHQSRVKQRTDN